MHILGSNMRSTRKALLSIVMIYVMAAAFVFPLSALAQDSSGDHWADFRLLVGSWGGMKPGLPE